MLIHSTLKLISRDTNQHPELVKTIGKKGLCSENGSKPTYTPRHAFYSLHHYTWLFPWCVTLAMSLDMNIELVFLSVAPLILLVDRD